MRQMPYKEVVEAYEGRELRIIDVREPDEYEEVHVEGVELFPLSELRQGDRPEPDDRPTALICRSGGRSEMAAEMLEQNDEWGELINVSDGTEGAVEAGEQHVVRGDDAPGD